MTAFDALMIFWVLPSLVVLLVLIKIDCYIESYDVDCIDSQRWRFFMIVSFIYPFGVIVIIFGVIESGILTKPISEIWQK